MLRLSAVFIPTLLALGACDGGKAVDNSAQPIAENGAATANDPMLRAALRDPIMVDPMLVGRANADAIRPPIEPYSARMPPDGVADTGKPPETDRIRSAPAAASPCPQCTAAKRALTLGALAEAQGVPFNRCAGAIGYSPGWANRLPATLPLYHQANVLDAAGADGAACALRGVRFRTTAAPQRLLDWYYTRARVAGFAVQHRADGSGEHALVGHLGGGGAFLLLVRTAPEGGSIADLLVESGR